MYGEEKKKSWASKARESLENLIGEHKKKVAYMFIIHYFSYNAFERLLSAHSLILAVLQESQNRHKQTDASGDRSEFFFILQNYMSEESETE